MKNYLSLVAMFLLFVLFFVPGQAFGQERNEKESIFLGVNDDLLNLEEEQSFLLDGHSYIPIRQVAELLDIKLTWNSSTGTLLLQKQRQQLLFDIKNDFMVRNNFKISPAPLKVIDDRIYVQARIIAEVFDYKISYDHRGPFVRLTNSSASVTNEAFYIEHAELMNEQKKTSKTAYLTFDDGPNQYTEKILDVLERYQAKATFFMMKDAIAKHESVVKRMANEQQGLGCHGVTHDKKQFYRSPSSAVNEMNICQQTLSEVSQVVSALIRVPYGSNPHMTAPFKAAVDRVGFKMWDWNVDSIDWKLSSASAIANHTIKQIEDLDSRGEAPIILMHDRKLSVEALPKILEHLQDLGYSFAVLTEDMKEHQF